LDLAGDYLHPLVEKEKGEDSSPSMKRAGFPGEITQKSGGEAGTAIGGVTTGNRRGKKDFRMRMKRHKAVKTTP